jgi:hypothetical protein
MTNRYGLPADLWEEVTVKYDALIETYLKDGKDEPDEPEPRDDDATLYFILSDIEDLINGGNLPQKWLRPVRAWFIAKGVYRAISESELSRTQTLNCRKWEFIMDKTKYVFAKHIERAP